MLCTQLTRNDRVDRPSECPIENSWRSVGNRKQRIQSIGKTMAAVWWCFHCRKAAYAVASWTIQTVITLVHQRSHQSAKKYRTVDGILVRTLI
jgi:orotate phosphoribosyltransferase-like protein